MRLDIVIPAHNEQHRIDRTLAQFRSRIADPDVRFMVAMDRCTDATPAIVDDHARRDRRVVPIRYPKLGKGGVIMETLRRCDADLVGFVDADCATPPAEFLNLVEAVRRADADMAIGSRWHRSAVLPGRRPLARRLESRVFAGLVRTLFGLPYRDTQCGAKVFRRQVTEAVLPLMSSRDFLFDVELLIAARSMGFDVLEVPTVWVDRPGSRLSAGRDGRRMAMSLLRLWMHMRVLPLPAADSRPDVVDLGSTPPVDGEWARGGDPLEVRA
ncbi:MAG TPA: glycosyltransferase [Acidimicrobiales bacterium]|nr:glycosyltransferase [Acidimicrobiales bacterium]